MKRHVCTFEDRWFLFEDTRIEVETCSECHRTFVWVVRFGNRTANIGASEVKQIGNAPRFAAN